MVGYWMMPPTRDFAPPKALADFLSSGAAPVYIGFGSMKGNPAFCKRLSTMAISALMRANLRGILLGGWAGLTAQVLDVSTDEGRALSTYASEHVLELPSCPHDWLFPRCAAVVHHGGAGTTSVGLRAGRPTVICAVTGDQPWHAAPRPRTQPPHTCCPRITLGRLLCSHLAHALCLLRCGAAGTAR